MKKQHNAHYVSTAIRKIRWPQFGHMELTSFNRNVVKIYFSLFTAKTKESEKKKTGGGPQPKLSAAEEEVISYLADKPQMVGIAGSIDGRGGEYFK